MAKTADIYFDIDSWNIIENGFHPQYGTVAESIFSLGNEYMGIRGIMEEGYSGDTLIGSYFNGIYERQQWGKSYKSVVECSEYMINSVNWLSVELKINGETLDLHCSEFSNFKRVLNLKDGLLTRSVVWCLSDGKKVEVAFERFLSMEDAKVGAQKITLKAINFEGTANVTMKLDFSNIHRAAGANLWDCEKSESDKGFLGILGTTKTTKQQVYSCCSLKADSVIAEQEFNVEKQVGRTYEIALSEGKAVTVERVVYNLIRKENE